MKNNVQSIERAFQILQAVHLRPGGITVGELSTTTQLHLSTTSRITSTLEYIGAIERIEGRLFIGETINTLATEAPWPERLISIATPHLQELASLTQEAVGLTRIEGHECHIFFQIPSSHNVQVRDWTGEKFPLHVTSTGKLYLAYLPEAEQAPFLTQPLPSLASETKTAEQLQAEFAQVKAGGVAWTINELEDGLTSIAAPIFNRTSQFIAGLYVSIPNYRVGDKNQLAEQVSATAAVISRQIGYQR